MILDKKLAQIINKLNVSTEMRAPTLIIVEDENASNENYSRMVDVFHESSFVAAYQASDLLTSLKQGSDKVIYFERNSKLADNAVQVVTEYGTGILSTQSGNGMDVTKFDPSKVICVIVATRSQVETSYPRLFEYVGNIETL